MPLGNLSFFALSPHIQMNNTFCFAFTEQKLTLIYRKMYPLAILHFLQVTESIGSHCYYCSLGIQKTESMPSPIIV